MVRLNTLAKREWNFRRGINNTCTVTLFCNRVCKENHGHKALAKVMTGTETKLEWNNNVKNCSKYLIQCMALSYEL